MSETQRAGSNVPFARIGPGQLPRVEGVGTIEYFEHTADVGLRVTGTNRDDLFRTAAEGLFDYIVVNRDEVHDQVSESIALQAASPADLLAGWLNELIFRFETTYRLYTRFDVEVADDGTKLEATIGGEAIDRDRHILDHEVKAVTHHGLTLQATSEGWLAELVLDI